MTGGTNNTGEPLEVDPQEELLGELINEYFDRRQSGEALSEDDFLAEHSEHADLLREHLVGLRLLSGLGSSQRQTLPGEETAAATGSSAQQSLGAEAVPPEIPGYKVLKQIGRGGMGVVYKATQLSTRRPVALKLLLEGPLASDQSKKRFEREITLATQLNHANIIPIYDSGTCNGRMFYAMEYVRGKALHDYLAAEPLDLRRKLSLFLSICAAVRHAHQRGVVHRDLKPSNVLVDADGAPHILDFGLAKANALVDTTTSVTAQVVGTPAYMSPEQAAGDPSGIDVRTDIYSLGVVLYEMLTKKMPYETSVAMGKALDNIAHAEPDPPSKHDNRIDAELDAILMKSLEKGKDDRYQSLDSFAGDVERYMAGDPISVKPASAFYLLKKAVWKHKFSVGAVAAIFLVASVFSLLVYQNTSKQKQLQQTQAEAERLRVEKQQRDAMEAKAAADRAKAAELQKRWLEVLPPDVARQLRAIMEISDSVSSGEDTSIALMRVASKAAANINLDTSETRSKDFDPGFALPLTSGRPTNVEQDESPDKKAKEDAAATAEVVRLLLEHLKPKPVATTRPAATQPAVVAVDADAKSKEKAASKTPATKPDSDNDESAGG